MTGDDYGEQVVNRHVSGRTTLVGTIVFALAALGLAACESSNPPPADHPVDADAYSVVIAQFVSPPSTDPDQRRVVFVAGVSDETLSLDDQVAIIDGFAETHDVRFVDDFAAAVDADLPGLPPKNDGILIGVGKISSDVPHTVRVEIYVNADDIEARLVTIAFRNDAWVIVSVEPVEPEVLVDDQ
jgi:hypothetical protein